MSRYDNAGIRTSKTVDGVETKYTYLGGTLVSQKTGDEVINFAYSAGGAPYGFSYNGQSYFYLLNLQGDVIGIYDSNGNVVVRYTYDSWGKLISITGESADTVGIKNPLRYRGYYYDTETELYYLQSRYYDPETCRFINADSLLVAGDDYIQGVNMFAYCQNNPVMYSDPSGQKANALTFLHRIISRFIFGNVGGTDESLFEIIVMFNAATKALGYNFSGGEIFVSTDVSSSGVVHVIVTLSNTQLNGEAPNNYIIEMFYGNNSEWAAENKLCDESSFIEGILGFASSSIVSYFVPPLAPLMILLELGIALSPDEYKILVDDMLIAASRNPQANTYGILQIYYAGTNKFVYKHS